MDFKGILRVSLTILTLALSGCGTSGIQSSSKSQRNQAGLKVAGEIGAVNEEFDYIVVRCELAPPAGAEAKVFRGKQQVATLRFSRISDYPYFSADILDGDPAKGDLVVY